MPEPTRGLRARILEALVTAPAAFVRDSESAAAHVPPPWRRHDQHKYDGGCALCRGEADTLTDAVMAVLDKAPAGIADAARFDSDPEAVAWARTKIERLVERAEQFEQHARDASNLEMAAHWRITATFMRRTLLGGKGCVIAAFDDRLPEMTGRTGSGVPGER